jgi:flavin reductase (DIM6/NTAB) family NADH-FMN oxidoreductase RutF
VSGHVELGELDYPMFIVTAAAGGERAGCLVGFATQCSIDPLRFIVCLSDKNRTFRVAQKASLLAVHLVPEGADDLARLFGSETGDEIDKFERCSWTPGPEGTPVLDDCGNWFAGQILDRVDVGDHWAFLLEPLRGADRLGQGAFSFQEARWIEPGHEA